MCIVTIEALDKSVIGEKAIKSQQSRRFLFAFLSYKYNSK